MSDEKTYSLSIYLHKSSVNSFEDCIKEEVLDENNLNEHLVNRNRIGAEGKIFTSYSEPGPPEWQYDINLFTNSNIELAESSTNRAVVILKVDNRYMSITFGHGKYILNENKIVRNFGIKVAANLIDSDQIRNLNTMNIEDVIINVQRQSSAYSNKEDLQVDVYKDILKEVAGSPNRREGDAAPKFLVGTDFLKAKRKMNLENILTDLRYYKETYNQNTYKNNGFEWLDNILRIKDKSLISELNRRLKDAIKLNNGNVQIAANKPIDWSELDGFLLTGQNKIQKKENFNIAINSNEYFRYIRESRTPNVIDKLKKDRLLVLYNQNESVEKLSNIYNSIIFETEYDDKFYILSHGEWFEINKDYYRSIIRRVEEIEVEKDIEFIEYDENHSNEFSDGEYNEGRYNKHLSELDGNFLLDKKNFIPPVPGNNPIEPCDIFTRNKELIHIKRYNGSSSLSHLLSQGLVSANLLINTDFKNHINEQIGEEIIHENDPINVFKVVYAVIHKDRNKTIHEIFPFFTKVNLVKTTEQLRRMQIKYSIKKIDVKSFEE